MIENELGKLTGLMEAGTALVQYARTLFPGTDFVANTQGRYVAQPENFVTFKVQSARANNIRVTLRGNPDEFLEFSELPLKADMAGYSSFTFNDVRQLAAAANHIRRASEIYQKGRERTQKKPRIVEG